MRLFDYFDRAFVINLPERTDRRAELVEELRLAGIDSDSPKLEFFAAIKPQDRRNFANRGTRGCFLSHLSVLKLARERNLRNVLVMEDDLVLSPHFPRDEEGIVEQLCEREWGVVYLGSLLQPFGDAAAILEPLTIPLIGCHFYAVNGFALGELIDYLELVESRPAGHPDGGGVPVDGALNMFRDRHTELKNWIAVPNLGGQRSTRSDITPRWFDRLPVVSQMIEFARLWRRTRKRGQETSER